MSDALPRQTLARAAARLNAGHCKAGLLPPLILMTDDERLRDPVAAAKALPQGSLVIVRSRDAARRADLAETLLRLPLFVLIAGDPALVARLGADGLHLPETRAHEAAHWRALHPRWIIGAARAANPHLDFVLLSPVFPTRSHRGRPSLGAVRANTLAKASRVPAYALGGIDARNARLLHGFAGIAAIGALDIDDGV
ncbi:MAG TPA: thiamine phosphate synthase [Rhizomicrobium sp.]|nr:thiamine phosphate synthase [Rhizomicrobium sp.]